MIDPLAEAVSQLTPILDSLGIRYVVVGSLASSAHGVYRATADGDLLVQFAPGQTARLVKALGRNWYADAETIDRALRERRAFNLIHIPTAQKIDIFPAVNDFHATQMERASVIPVFSDADAIELPVASPEDILLAKLRWYRDGGEVSDRQWADITGILATNPGLDFTYARSWAARLRVEDLLARAVEEVARDSQL